MLLALLKTYFSDDAGLWLDLADIATTNTQRAYCVKRFQTYVKGRSRWQRFKKIVVDIWNLLW
jgi:hypothetical protein